jgi:uncharacterized protein involved in outer membrane biogenesis
MKKLFKWLLLSVAALAIGIAVILYNPHIIKGPLERYLSDVAGYSVTLSGELKIDTGRLIEITAKNIHVSGPDWASREDLITIGQLDLALNTASIFKDIVLTESLQLEDLQFNLETNEEGIGNWITADQPSSPSKKTGDRSLVVFNDIQARNATIRFRNGKTAVENIFTIASLSHHQQADGMLHTTLNGDLNNRRVEYTHTVGPYANLLDGRDVSYEATGHFGELALKGDAYIDNLLEPRYPKFNLDMQGPNIDEITAMLGIDDLGGGGFSLRASGNQINDTYEAEINGKVGDISLSASAQSSDIAQLNELDLDVAINGPSLGSFTRVFGIEHWPDKPFSLKGQAQRVGSTLNVHDLTLNIGGTRLLLDALLTEFPTLEASRIKLLVSGDEIEQFHELIGIKGVATGPFQLNGKLDASPEGVELLQVELETSLGQLMLTGTVGPPPTFIGSKLDVHLDGVNANAVMSVFGIDMLPEQAFNLNTGVEVVENGLLIERGVLVTKENERLEVDGFVALGSGSKGSDFKLNISGKNLAQVLKRHLDNVNVPDKPYELSGRVHIKEEGIGLEDMSFVFEAIQLKADGLVKLNDQLSGTVLDFEINGENLSSLSQFQAIGNSLDMFVKGQPYQAAGHFTIEPNGWELKDVISRIGQTALNFDALISKQPGLAGSNIHLSVKGPDLNNLLVKQGEPGLPEGAFETSTIISLSDQKLSINELRFKTLSAHGEVDLEFGWPLGLNHDFKFNAHIQGEDIRNFLPHMESFEAEVAAFQLHAVGNKQGDVLTVDQFESGVGNLRVSLKGRVNNNNPEVAFHVLSEDISKLGRLNDEPLPALPLDIKADFTGNADQLTFRNLVGSLGESRLNGELEVPLKGSKPGIKLIATSDYIDARPFIDQKEPGNEADTTIRRERLIPATPLPLDALASADLQIKLDVAELRYWQDSITDLVLDVEQHNGSLNVSQLSYKAPRGKLKASLSINPTGSDKADVKIDLGAQDFVFNLSGLPKEKLDKVPAFDVDFHASGNGANVREVAGNLNGSLYMASKGGSAENVDLSLLETFLFDQLFSVIMPKSQENLNTQFSCIAASLQISDGQVTTNPAIAFTSQKIAVVTKGILDLKTEKLNFNFNSTPTNALKINPGEMFHPYILISGTLAKPAVGVDPGKAVLHGGAAIATMGISILAKGMLDRASNAIPVCEEMLNNPPRK